jgi:hypothetical protein
MGWVKSKSLQVDRYFSGKVLESPPLTYKSLSCCCRLAMELSNFENERARASYYKYVVVVVVPASTFLKKAHLKKYVQLYSSTRVMLCGHIKCEKRCCGLAR